jgi:hypothetical protein
MNRTWDENKTAINQLWPVAQFTEEEKRLWRDDLSGLDQDTLYDAIRNAKRNHDSIYPQLKWMLDEYRSLFSSRRAALRIGAQREKKTEWNIDDAQDREARNEMMEWVDRADPREYRNIYDAVFAQGTFERLHSITALRIITYAKQRLLGIEPKFGKVDGSGGVKPFFTAEGVEGPTPLSLSQNT